MKHNFLALFIILIHSSLLAQDLDLSWVNNFGGTNSDLGRSILTDSERNLFITGSFQDSVDFDPSQDEYNLVSSGGYDAFVQKLDENGDLVWVNSTKGTSDENGNSISIDEDGNIYSIGTFEDTLKYLIGSDTNKLISKGHMDIFIQKLDIDGNIEWVKSLGGSSYEVSYSISNDVFGDVIITGYFGDTVDFDLGDSVYNLISYGYNDAFILKLSNEGEFIWAKSYGGLDNTIAETHLSDINGNIYVAGYYLDSVDFDPGLGVYNLESNGSTDIYIQKLDSNGDFIWAKSFGGPSTEYTLAVGMDLYGSIYVTGAYKDTVDFDPGDGIYQLNSNGSSDAFLLKLDENGLFVWAKSIGGAEIDMSYGVSIDISGNIYMTGSFKGAADFDPSDSTFYLTSNGLEDIFIQKYDLNGNLHWTESIGGPDMDRGISIVSDNWGNVSLGGYFRATVDFDLSTEIDDITSYGATDYYVVKYKQCPITGLEIISSCEPYTWSNGITYTESNNSAIDTLVNYEGCDSIVSLDLYIESIDLDLTINDPTIVANLEGVEYQWLDCDNDYMVIDGETSQSFTALSNGNYAVEITQNGCTDTSACITISSTAIQDSERFKSIKVFPNPSNGKFNIELSGLSKISIKVISMSGQLIYIKENITTQDFEFELNTDSGIYILELNSAGNSEKIKLIVN